MLFTSHQPPIDLRILLKEAAKNHIALIATLPQIELDHTKHTGHPYSYHCPLISASNSSMLGNVSLKFSGNICTPSYAVIAMGWL